MSNLDSRDRAASDAPGRGVSTRIGLYFGVIQLFFSLTWVVYVIYLPQLAAQVGIDRRAVPWILLLDQAIFALCDWAAGIAADRVAKILGRLGRIVAAVTALSALAFLLLPVVTSIGAPVFLVLVVIWSITSSALRAPPLTLLGRYTTPDRQPWVGSLFLLGGGVAGALAPFLAGWIAGYDPRIVFGTSALSLVVVTLSIIWAEKALARSTSPESAGQSERNIPTGRFVVFLAAILLLAIGFQVYSSVNAAPLFAKFARPADVDGLVSVFWIGVSLLMLPVSRLAKRFGGVVVLALGALVAAAAAVATTHAGNAASLGVSQFICGGAWGGVLMSAVAAALALGYTGHEGKAVGAVFSLMAVAAMARIALVAAHLDHVHAVAAALPWVPAVCWLVAALILLPGARRPAPPA